MATEVAVDVDTRQNADQEPVVHGALDRVSGEVSEESAGGEGHGAPCDVSGKVTQSQTLWLKFHVNTVACSPRESTRRVPGQWTTMLSGGPGDAG